MSGGEEVTGPGRRRGKMVVMLRHRYEPGVARVMDRPRPGRVVAIVRREQ